VEKDMAKVETFKCDQCGKQKGEVNHWYKAMSVVALGEQHNYLKVVPWESTSVTTLEDSVRHLCGQACVVSELNEWMNSAKPTE
jgi:hypothetical protein